MKHGDDLSFSDELTLISASATDRGRVRETNQDQFLIAPLKKSMLVDSKSLNLEQKVFGDLQCEILLVADGMGGHVAGEKVSQLAIQYLVRRLLTSIHWFSQHEEDDQRESAFINELKDLHQRCAPTDPS